MTNRKFGESTLKGLTAIVIAMMLLFTTSGCNKGASAEGSARAPIQYYYYPTTKIYYNRATREYYYPSAGTWIKAKRLPAKFIYNNRTNRVKLLIDSNQKPYTNNKKHQQEYKAGAPRRGYRRGVPRRRFGIPF